LRERAHAATANVRREFLPNGMCMRIGARAAQNLAQDDVPDEQLGFTE
jgi:hypothetical protein